MTDKPQFTLRAILGAIFAISVPLGMIAAGGVWFVVGALLIVPVLFTSAIYLVGRRKSIFAAVGIGVYLTLLFAIVVGSLLMLIIGVITTVGR
jgi:hypothetical protein